MGPLVYGSSHTGAQDIGTPYLAARGTNYRRSSGTCQPVLSRTTPLKELIPFVSTVTK